MKKLNTINADTQQIIPHAPLVRRGGDLPPGAPPAGRSTEDRQVPGWPCRYVSVPHRANRSGASLYTRASLYLYLEDSFQRIQSLLFDLTPPSLHFAMMAEQLHSGLVEQIA